MSCSISIGAHNARVHGCPSARCNCMGHLRGTSGSSSRICRSIELVRVESVGSARTIVAMNIVDVRDVIDVVVVVIISPVPVATFKSFSPVTAAVEDAAVEPDGQAPITGVPAIHSTAPAPIARCPQTTNVRRIYPHARDPLPAVIPSPIARGPFVTIARTGRLIVGIDWKRWWRGINGHGGIALVLFALVVLSLRLLLILLLLLILILLLRSGAITR